MKEELKKFLIEKHKHLFENIIEDVIEETKKEERERINKKIDKFDFEQLVQFACEGNLEGDDKITAKEETNNYFRYELKKAWEQEK